MELSIGVGLLSVLMHLVFYAALFVLFMKPCLLMCLDGFAGILYVDATIFTPLLATHYNDYTAECLATKPSAVKS